MLFVKQFYACFVSATFITIDPTELTLSTDSFIEETQRCLGVTFSCKEKIDRISRFINRPIVVAPLTPYFHPLFSKGFHPFATDHPVVSSFSGRSF